MALLLPVLQAVSPRTAGLLVLDNAESIETTRKDRSKKDRGSGSPGAPNVDLGRILRELKNALVGNEQAKSAALQLGVVEELLKVLDESESTASVAAGLSGGSGGTSGSLAAHEVCLHAFGLLGILTCSACSSNSNNFSTLGGRIVGHVSRTMAACSGRAVGDMGYHYDDRGEKLRLTVLRCLNSLCSSIARPTEPSISLSSIWGTSTLLGLAQQIVEDISRGVWSPVLTTLGVTALAVMTRDRELARMTGALVISSGTFLLRPILAPSW